MESITAIDGSILDFVHISDADQRCVRSLITSIYDQRNESLFMQTLTSDLQATAYTFTHTYFIKKRGEGAYVGVVYYGTGETEAVAIEVAVAPDWRLNGYGRAAVLAVCWALEHLAEDHYFCVPTGRNDAFCKGLHMYQSSTCWFIRLRELLT